MKRSKSKELAALFLILLVVCAAAYISGGFDKLSVHSSKVSTTMINSYDSLSGKVSELFSDSEIDLMEKEQPIQVDANSQIEKKRG